MPDILQPSVRQFLDGTPWSTSRCEPLTGDASVRKYYRLRQPGRTAILMDASAIPQCVPPFLQIDRHLRELGLSAPEILSQDPADRFLVVEDFGDETFARLLDRGSDAGALFAAAIDVLVALHASQRAVPAGLREYHPAQMLADLELFLEWCAPKVGEAKKAEFRAAWRDVLPLAHQVPQSLLLRDYHAANLMLLSEREGVLGTGLLDFQDAYAGPVTYDLMSLLEDARRDVPEGVRQQMIARYLEHFPKVAHDRFQTSMSIVAALRHTRVLGIFERLSRCEGKHEYKERHCPRVQGLLRSALRHPCLDAVKRWMEQHAL